MRAVQSRADSLLGPSTSYSVPDLVSRIRNGSSTQLHVAFSTERLGNSSFFTLSQVAFSLPIAFATSLEGSVIEMKPATLAPQDTAVSLKA